MTGASSYDLPAIDAVVNLWTHEGIRARPEWSQGFFNEKMRQDSRLLAGMTMDAFLAQLDSAGIERAFIIAAKAGPYGNPPGYRIPLETIAAACRQHPDRFHGLCGIDPFDGMKGVRELEHAIKDLGFVGAHLYPHWFQLAPDHAKYYPFYAKCVELDVPIQMQVGQSMVYSPDLPCRSVAQPITLDSVACDFPELKLIGIHVGIPWTDEMIAMAWKHKNVYIGSDAHSPRYWPESFVRYINTYGQDKVIFGTDFPVLGFKRTRDEVEALGLRPGPRRKLLRDNVIRIYKLDLTR